MPESRFARLAIDRYRLPPEFSDRLLTPALVIYLARVRENLATLLGQAEGCPDRLRPHVKTLKIPEVFAELTRVGIRQFKCATTREALHLLRVLDREMVRQPDLLVAYPLVGPALDRLAALAKAHPRTRISVLCEDPDQIDRISGGLSIFVDVNPGMNRTGVPLEDDSRIHHIARLAGSRFRGLHYYDGHVRGSTGEERRAMAHEGYARLRELAERLAVRGVAISEIVTSGTPSFLHALDYGPLRTLGKTVHRVSPGTVVYHDLRTEQEIEELEFQPAALVLTRVVSLPASAIVTCDAGSKSIAAEAGDPCAFVLGHPGLRALTPSEEHLPLALDEGEAPHRGELLYLIPRHVCPTVNLAEQAVLVDADATCRLVSVDARAHDVTIGS